MTRIGSFEGWRLCLIAFPAIVALAWLSPASPPQSLLILAFAAAVANVAASAWSKGSASAVDLAVLLVTGFAASAYGAPSLADEVIFAACRMLLIGTAIAIVAASFRKLRGGEPMIAAADVALLTILSALLPLGAAIAGLASAMVLSVAIFAVLRRHKGSHLQLRDQLPIGATVPVIYFCVWLTCHLLAGA